MRTYNACIAQCALKQYINHELYFPSIIGDLNFAIKSFCEEKSAQKCPIINNAKHEKTLILAKLFKISILIRTVL